MAYEEYKILQAWHDVLVYDEGEGRRLELSCPSMVTPPSVIVPAQERWLDDTPPWAHERRSIIINRLRAAKCVVTENGFNKSSTLSPDGTFRVEIHHENDERCAWDTTSVICVPDNRTIFTLCYGLLGIIQFPEAGVVILPVSYAGKVHAVRVDVIARTFNLNPHDVEEPVDNLQSRIAATSSSGSLNLGLRSVIGNVGMLLGSLIFVAGGIWMSIAGTTSRERWTGAAAAMFFGLCAIVPILELFPSAFSPRKRPPDDRER